MEDKTRFEICSIEVTIVLLYKHMNSKEHKETETYLIRKSMTYCEFCKKEIRNDEWRDQIISENHLEFEPKIYYKVCKTKYDVSGYGGTHGSYQDNCRSAENNHILRETHKEKQERFDFYSC